MTTNQQKIVKLIAQYQLEHSEEKGILLKDLFNKCVEDMLAHSHKNLKEYLHEAKDHKIVIEKTNEDGNTMLYMPFGAPILEKIAND